MIVQLTKRKPTSGITIASKAGQSFLKTGKQPKRNPDSWHSHWKQMGLFAVDSLKREGIHKPTSAQISKKIKAMLNTKI
ncbi:MAG: hypothetical protein WCW13_06235 [archaeon]|jgi:hypothetical protein